MNKISIGISIIVVALIGVGVWMWQSGALPGGASDANAIVATVNGEEITRGELEIYMTQLAANFQVAVPDRTAGEERTQFERIALDQMINERLFAAGAQASGIVPSEADVDARLADIIAQFEDDAAYRAELATAGMTEEDLKNNIRQQLVVEAYFAQLTAGQDFSVSDAEIEAFYAEQFGDEADVSFEEVEDQIRAFLEDNRRQIALDEAIEGLRQNANIDIRI